MNSPEKVAVYNLEKTIANFVVKNTLKDIVNIYPALSPAYSPGGLSSMREERERLLDWLVWKTPEEIIPLFEITADKANERLAPWARIAMKAHAVGRRVVALCSQTLPHELVEAYANGIENSNDEIKIDYVMGRPLIIDDTGRYTGGLGSAQKITFYSELESQGFEIDFTADSFREPIGAVRRGRLQLIVNPEPRFSSDYRLFSRHRLYWNERNPNETRLEIAGINESYIYNLNSETDRERFTYQFVKIAIED